MEHRFTEEEKEALRLPEENFRKLVNFIRNNVRTKHGVVKDIVHKKDLEFIANLSEREQELLPSIASLIRKIDFARASSTPKKSR